MWVERYADGGVLRPEQNVINMIQSPRIPSSNKLRLAILYALRYQKLTGNAIPHVVDTLIENGVSADRARVSTGDACFS